MNHLHNSQQHFIHSCKDMHQQINQPHKRYDERFCNTFHDSQHRKFTDRSTTYTLSVQHQPRHHECFVPLLIIHNTANTSNNCAPSVIKCSLRLSSMVPSRCCQTLPDRVRKPSSTGTGRRRGSDTGRWTRTCSRSLRCSPGLRSSPRGCGTWTCRHPRRWRSTRSHTCRLRP
jgi:hypothetical protein